MQITDKQQKRIEEIAWKYDLKMILLFGSQVTGRTHKESDIAVLPEKNLTFEQEVYLNTDLVNVIRENANLTNLRKAPPLLIKEIIDNYKILYEKYDHVFDAFYLYALHRYREEGVVILKIRENKAKGIVRDSYRQFMNP